MTEKKYKCEQCKESFDGIKNYINHLENHKESLVDVPEKKKTLFERLFSFKKENTKNKAEVNKKMADEQKTEVKTEQPAQNDARFEAIERSISQLSGMITSMHNQMQQKTGTQEEEEETSVVEEPASVSKGKLMRLTVQVREKDMPSLLKEVQDKTEYTMENIEVIDKK